MTGHVRNVVFDDVPAQEQAAGLVCFASATMDGWRIHGVALRRSREGRIYFRYPMRHGRTGRRHPIVHPIDAATRAAFEREVLEILHERGCVPS